MIVRFPLLNNGAYYYLLLFLDYVEWSVTMETITRYAD